MHEPSTLFWLFLSFFLSFFYPFPTIHTYALSLSFSFHFLSSGCRLLSRSLSAVGEPLLDLRAGGFKDHSAGSAPHACPFPPQDVAGYWTVLHGKTKKKKKKKEKKKKPLPTDLTRCRWKRGENGKHTHIIHTLGLGSSGTPVDLGKLQSIGFTTVQRASAPLIYRCTHTDALFYDTACIRNNGIHE
jgi:hypothetical protein